MILDVLLWVDVMWIGSVYLLVGSGFAGWLLGLYYLWLAVLGCLERFVGWLVFVLVALVWWFVVVGFRILVFC